MNLPLSILEPLGLEAGLGHFSVVSSSPAIEGTIQQTTGTFMPPNPSDRVITGADDDPTRFAHADLVFAQLAPMVWVFTSFEGLTTPSRSMPAAASTSPFGREPPRTGPRRHLGRRRSVRRWDHRGRGAVRHASQEHHAGVALTDAALAEAWDRVDGFTTVALEAAGGVATGDPQALADLRVIGSHSASGMPSGTPCSATPGRRRRTGSSREGTPGPPSSSSWRKTKAESLLLLFDYLEVIVSYLDRPDVDWLEADGVVLEDTWVPDGSAGEYLSVIGEAAEGATWMMLFFTS